MKTRTLYEKSRGAAGEATRERRATMWRLLPWLVTIYAQDKPYYEVIFACLTVPQHRPHRDAIRTGYGQPGGVRTKLWFVVSEQDPGFSGDAFVAERKGDDLLVCDTAPGFDHIIGKVSCAIRHAFDTYIFDFFFKTDDDATLCIAQLVKDLRAAPSGPVYAGRRVKAGRALERGKPLERTLGLLKDPPHFGGHGYGVSYEVARFIAHPPAPLHHHLHEDTCFGAWLLGFDLRRMNLRAMTDHYYPNQKNLAGVSAARREACAAIMKQRYANGSAWDLYGSGCGFKQLPRAVPVERCVRVVNAARAAPRARPPPLLDVQRGSGLAVVVLGGGRCAEGIRCVADPGAGPVHLRRALAQVAAAWVVVVFRGTVAPCLSALRTELAARRGPLYAGASAVRRAPLPLELEERTKLGAAPEHFAGIAVLDGRLAAYVAAQAAPPLLAAGSAALPADVALGVWLAPFAADRRPLESLRACG